MKKPALRVTKWLGDIPIEGRCSLCPGTLFHGLSMAKLCARIPGRKVVLSADEIVHRGLRAGIKHRSVNEPWQAGPSFCAAELVQRASATMNFWKFCTASQYSVCLNSLRSSFSPLLYIAVFTVPGSMITTVDAKGPRSVAQWLRRN
jgi:hypothetical protein